ncbi:MAG: YggS family pyridoxal phosphate-dependent enzyme [Oscillospiraceae bacterium]|nr:YggS family pyridoxal phosphate-dependent enzyme [Oscillospiraceae bacterium]
MSIADNVARIRAEIEAAARAAGRDPAEITLVAASKMNGAERVREAIAAGVAVCGENRVQEMLEKQAQGAYEGAALHFIGHLQKNKVKQVVGLASLIHGADSLALLEVIERCAEKRGLTQDVLLEVNIGAEASKSGFAPEEIPSALAAAAAFSHIRVRGLMCIPPAGLGEEENRLNFTKMNKLFVDNGGKKYDNISMDFLSMGMSADFACAIACGSNMVRVGSAIFGPRPYQIPET